MLENTFMAMYNSDKAKEIRFTQILGHIASNYSPARDVQIRPGHVFKTYDPKAEIKILIVSTPLGNIVLHEASFNRPPYYINAHPKIPDSIIKLAGFNGEDEPENDVIQRIVGSVDGKIPNIGIVINDLLNWQVRWDEKNKLFDEVFLKDL